MHFFPKINCQNSCFSHYSFTFSHSIFTKFLFFPVIFWQNLQCISEIFWQHLQFFFQHHFPPNLFYEVHFILFNKRLAKSWYFSDEIHFVFSQSFGWHSWLFHEISSFFMIINWNWLFFSTSFIEILVFSAINWQNLWFFTVNICWSLQFFSATNSKICNIYLCWAMWIIENYR